MPKTFSNPSLMLIKIIGFFHSVFVISELFHLYNSDKICSNDYSCEFYGAKSSRMLDLSLYKSSCDNLKKCSEDFIAKITDRLYEQYEETTFFRFTNPLDKVIKMSKQFEGISLGRSRIEIDGSDDNEIYATHGEDDKKVSEDGMSITSKSDIPRNFGLEIIRLNFLKLHVDENGKVIKNNTIKICVRCLRNIQLYFDIRECMSDVTNRFNKLIDVSKLEKFSKIRSNGKPGKIQAICNKDNYVLQLERIPDRSNPNMPGEKLAEDVYYLIFVDGELYCCNYEIQRMYRFGEFDPKYFRVSIPKKKNLISNRSVEQCNVIYPEYRSGSVLENEDDLWEFDDAQIDTSPKKVVSNIYLIDQSCDKMNHCCFYNCNFENIVDIQIYKDIYGKISEKIKKLQKSEDVNSSIPDSFKLVPIGNVTLVFDVRNTLKLETSASSPKDICRNSYFSKVKNSFESSEGFDRTICTKCFLSIETLDKLLRKAEENKIQKILTIDKGPSIDAVDIKNMDINPQCDASSGDELDSGQENLDFAQTTIISAVFNNKGKCLVVMKYRFTGLFKFINYLEYIDLLGLVSNVFVKERYFLGFHGSRLALINFDLRDYIPIYQLIDNEFRYGAEVVSFNGHKMLEYERARFAEDGKFISADLNLISHFATECYHNLPNFKPKKISFVVTPAKVVSEHRTIVGKEFHPHIIPAMNSD